MIRSVAIEEYLTEVDGSLRVKLGRRERILVEARAHLLDQAEAHQHRGASREEAERIAIAAFGSPTEVAEGHGRDGATAMGRVAVDLANFAYRAGDYFQSPRNRWSVLGQFAAVTAGMSLFWLVGMATLGASLESERS